jgi:regulator of protease activity HflC (stomatin/prohibitin superfamily)
MREIFYIATGILLLITLSLGGCYLNASTKEWRYEIEGKAMLAQAENEKKVKIEEAKAEYESAKYKKDADIERAKGIAEANRIINESLTDQYIRWLYVENIKETNNQIIYLPTEAGLPILESSRLFKAQKEN